MVCVGKGAGPQSGWFGLRASPLNPTFVRRIEFAHPSRNIMVHPLNSRRATFRNAARAAGVVALGVGAVISLGQGSFTRQTAAAATERFIMPATPGVRQVPGEYRTIQAAIDAAIPGDTIVLAAGDYAERVDFDGKSLTMRSGAAAERTAIVGDGSSGAVLSIVGATTCGSRLTGLTISGGKGQNGCGVLLRDTDAQLTGCIMENNDDGGVVIEGGAPTLTNCQMEHNHGALAGGGLRSSAATATLVDCVVEANDASTFGGGIYVQGGRAVLIDSTIHANRTRSGAWGGGIYAEGAQIDAFGMTITENASEEAGGAAYLAGSTGTFHGCRFSGNISREAWSVAAQDGSVSLTDSVVCGRAEDHLGGMIDQSGAEFANSCFADCDHDGLADDVQIMRGLADDCDGNGVPDQCDADCNGNGIVDRCEIAAGLCSDCNGNGTPDRCEIEWGLATDADHDGRPDSCGTAE